MHRFPLWRFEFSTELFVCQRTSKFRVATTEHSSIGITKYLFSSSSFFFFFLFILHLSFLSLLIGPRWSSALWFCFSPSPPSLSHSFSLSFRLSFSFSRTREGHTITGGRRAVPLLQFAMTNSIRGKPRRRCHAGVRDPEKLYKNHPAPTDTPTHANQERDLSISLSLVSLLPSFPFLYFFFFRTLSFCRATFLLFFSFCFFEIVCWKRVLHTKDLYVDSFSPLDFEMKNIPLRNIFLFFLVRKRLCGPAMLLLHMVKWERTLSPSKPTDI